MDRKNIIVEIIFLGPPSIQSKKKKKSFIYFERYFKRNESFQLGFYFYLITLYFIQTQS